MKTVSVTEEQVRYYRAHQLHLAGPGAATPHDAAAAIIGAQAQVESQAVLALSQRTASRPTAAHIEDLLSTERSLVRCWGQRDTMHIYTLADWSTVIAALPQWTQSGRRFPSPPADVIAASLARMQELGRPVTRQDLFDLVPDATVDAWTDFLQVPRETARRYATGRIFWVLARNGDVCAAGKAGSQQQYVARSTWFPTLDWSPPTVEHATTTLTRRYLALSGPASAADIAYHFGAPAKVAKAWLATLARELVTVECAGHNNLVALHTSIEQLQASVGDWPVRLLPSYDMKWMSHKDKSWVTPNIADEKRVWRKSAVIAACVVHRGQPVANWTVKKRAKAIDVTLEPLSGWSSAFLPAVQGEANAIAAHWGRSEAVLKP